MFKKSRGRPLIRAIHNKRLFDSENFSKISEKGSFLSTYKLSTFGYCYTPFRNRLPLVKGRQGGYFCKAVSSTVFYSIRVPCSASRTGFETEECANILFESGKLYCTIHNYRLSDLFCSCANIFAISILYLCRLTMCILAVFISFTVFINKIRNFFIKAYIYPIDIFRYSIIIKRKPMEKS